jgi:hypothetical protein
VLNECQLSWQDAVSVGQNFSMLRELYLGGNKVCALEGDQHARGLEACFPQLQLLDLMDNSIAGWESVMQLASLPALTELKLSGNPLGKITVPGALGSGLDFLLSAAHTCCSVSCTLLDGNSFSSLL